MCLFHSLLFLTPWKYACPIRGVNDCHLQGVKCSSKIWKSLRSVVCASYLIIIGSTYYVMCWLKSAIQSNTELHMLRLVRHDIMTTDSGHNHGISRHLSALTPWRGKVYIIPRADQITLVSCTATGQVAHTKCREANVAIAHFPPECERWWMLVSIIKEGL